FDGEERTWHLLEHQSSARTQTSSSMGAIETFRGRTYSLNLQGQAEERFGVEGSLALSGMLESLDDCPCGLDLTDLIYFTSSSMFSAIYKAIESEVSVETIERIDEGVYSVSGSRSEEHTSELQSRENLVCRLLLEKKKKKTD